MTQQSASPDGPSRPVDDTATAPSRSPWSRADSLVAPTLLVGWIVILMALVLVGERDGDAADLRAQVAAGDVEEVTARGELGPDDTGSAVVELRWSDEWVDRVTSVVQVRGVAGRDSLEDPEVTGRFRGDLADYLTASGGTVTVHSEPYRSGAQLGPLLGWQLHGTWVVCFGLLWLATLAHLVSGAKPLFATRWAWFWLLGLAPVGPIAYVLLGRGVGPPAERSSTIRLRGGWAFILVGAIGAALPWTG